MRLGKRSLPVAALAGVIMLTVAAAAAWASVQAHPVPTWQTNGRVNAIAVEGTTVYIGGQFTSVRPAGDPPGTGEVTRNHVAAFSLTTGNLLPWDPNVTGTIVRAIQPVGSDVYIGGTFSTVGTTSRKNLAEVDGTTGAVVSGFNPKPNSTVLALQYKNGVLYAGGDFTTVAGGTHSHLAALNATNGTSTSFAASADNEVKAMTLTADGSRLVVGGSFTNLDGSSAKNLGAVDPSSGALVTWNTHPSYNVTSLAADSNGVYVGGAGGGGNFGGFNPSTGSQLWKGGTDGNIQGMAVLGGIVYVGGHFTTYCGAVTGQHICSTPTAREHLLAVDETGVLQSWNPSANSALGVFGMAGDASSGDLFVGGDFTSTGQRKQQGFAQYTP